jgi:hypothetical protein
MFVKVVVQNDVIKVVEIKEIPEQCKWMKKVLENRKHLG